VQIYSTLIALSCSKSLAQETCIKYQNSAEIPDMDLSFALVERLVDMRPNL
jgi:hypothetical protein